MKKFDLLKKTWMLLVAFLCLATFAACDSDDDTKTGEPYFSIEDEYGSLSVTQSGYNLKTPYTFYTVRSNRNWEIVADGDYNWCQVFPTTGEDDGVFRVIAKANDSTDVRVAYFRIIVDGVEQPVMLTVTQDPNDPYINVKARDEEGKKNVVDTMYLSGKEGSAYAFVSSNVEWTVTSDAAWLTAEAGNDSTKISVVENTATDARYGNLSFSYVDDPNVTTVVVVRQEAGNYLKVLTTEYKISKKAQTIACAVDANINWTVTSNDSWITATAVSPTLASLVVTENTTGAPRTGTITISSPVDPSRFSNTVTIIQDELGDMTGFPQMWTCNNLADDRETTWKSTQTILADSSATAIISFHEGVGNDDPAIVYDASGANPGKNPRVTGPFDGDYWQFAVPFTNVRANTKLKIVGNLASSAKGNRYYRVQYSFDGTNWTNLTTSQTATNTIGGVDETVDYDIEMTSSSSTSDIPVNFTIEAPAAYTSGTFYYRLLIVGKISQDRSRWNSKTTGGTARLTQTFTISAQQ